MPRLSTQPPKMAHVKSTDAAVVYVNGKRKYLGPWGSEKARERYNQFLSAWIECNGQIPDSGKPKRTSIAELSAEFLRYAQASIQWL